MNKHTHYKFRLYVADQTPNSELALSNLKTLCRLHLAGRHEIEVVDVLRTPQRALDDGIFLTPTLVRLAPLPRLRIVGTLNHPESVLLALGLGPLAA